MWGLTPLDFALVGFPLLFALHGAWRGFIGALLSPLVRFLVALYGGMILAAWAIRHPVVKSAISQIAGSTSVPDLIIQVALLLLAFIVSMIALGWLKRRMQGNEPRVSGLSRIGGAVAGFVVGALISHVAVASQYALLEARDQVPPFMQKSVSFPYIKATAQMLRNALMQVIPGPT